MWAYACTYSLFRWFFSFALFEENWNLAANIEILKHLNFVLSYININWPHWKGYIKINQRWDLKMVHDYLEKKEWLVGEASLSMILMNHINHGSFSFVVLNLYLFKRWCYPIRSLSLFFLSFFNIHHQLPSHWHIPFYFVFK